MQSESKHRVAVQALVDKYGFTVEQAKHFKLRRDGAPLVVVSRTPGCHYALRNVEGDLKRALRAAGISSTSPAP
jgi:hypothetical protein